MNIHESIPMSLNTPKLFFSGDVSVRQEERKKKEEKDSRNLYLAREGMIREGTQVGANTKDPSGSTSGIDNSSVSDPIHFGSRSVFTIRIRIRLRPCKKTYKSIGKKYIT